MMQRRHFTALLAASATALLPLTAHAAIHNLQEAINKAGRQRMLSQRAAKAWLALALNAGPDRTRQVLEQSVSTFDLQLIELKAFAPTPAIQDTYRKLDTAWGEYKTALIATQPSPSQAGPINTLADHVLELAQLGTAQLEKTSERPAGRLVNLSGRQRMLSQRMAKSYYAQAAKVAPEAAAADLARARKEFVDGMAALRAAPETTPAIRDSLALADSQWLFFENALRSAAQGTASTRSMTGVFVASENLLQVMDKVTGQYSALS